MNEASPPIPDCTIFLLAKAYQKAHSQFKKRLAPYGLTNMQHLILEGLWYRPGQTAAELGKMLVLDKATLSGVIDRLSEAGWIARRPDPDDRRIHRLFPSEKADAVKAELIAERTRANDELLSGFSLQEQVLFKRLLKDLM